MSKFPFLIWGFTDFIKQKWVKPIRISSNDLEMVVTLVCTITQAILQLGGGGARHSAWYENSFIMVAYENFFKVQSEFSV